MYACIEGRFVIKVQVGDIIHHKILAVDNLHDRGIQNDVARLGIMQPHKSRSANTDTDTQGSEKLK